MNKFFPKDLIIVVILFIILNILRIIIFGNMSFVWLFWNVFLALIPFVVSKWLVNLYEKQELNKYIFSIFGILWLLFLPNAPYLVTDIIHTGVVRSVPRIYDALLLFTVAYIGIILFSYSLSHIKEIIKSRMGERMSEIIIFLIILFSSFGIYIGRFLRFNSWDVVSDPIDLLKTSHTTFFQNTDSETYLYIFLFTVFFYVFYRVFSYKNK